MNERITLDNLSDFFYFDEAETENGSENISDEVAKDRYVYRNYSKGIALVFGYMLGVEEKCLRQIDEAEYEKLEHRLNKDKNINAIRHLNNLRSSIMLSFNETLKLINDLHPIDTLDKLKDDFKALRKLGISIYTGKKDLYEYIRIINSEISKKIDLTEPFFPEWVNFHYIKFAFVCPSNYSYEAEGKRYSANRDIYPYHRFFNWPNAEEVGNILLTDEKLLKVLYKNCGEVFIESERVIDTSELVKQNIHDFIHEGIRIQIFIDGENVNPYRFSSMINSLSDDEVKKIDKIIVYYDSQFSSKAWVVLRRFVRGIEVDLREVKRLIEGKSLVDHKLVAAVSKAVYSENIDSIVLCTSDSDFWAVIEEIDRAKYLVMIESEKCGHEFKDKMRQHDIFYCYIDKFILPEKDRFLDTVLEMEAQRILNETINSSKFNLKTIFKEAIRSSFAEISPQRTKNIYENYANKLKLIIDDDGTIHLELKE